MHLFCACCCYYLRCFHVFLCVRICFNCLVYVSWFCVWLWFALLCVSPIWFACAAFVLFVICMFEFVYTTNVFYCCVCSFLAGSMYSKRCGWLTWYCVCLVLLWLSVCCFILCLCFEYVYCVLFLWCLFCVNNYILVVCVYRVCLFLVHVLCVETCFYICIN